MTAVTSAFPPRLVTELDAGLEVWLEVPWALIPEAPDAGSDAELRTLLRKVRHSECMRTRTSWPDPAS